MDNQLNIPSAENARATGNFVSAWLRSLRRPTWGPPGANRFDEPLGGRIPVVLIHGTWLNAFNTFAFLAPELVRRGHAVFALNYGRDVSSLCGRLRGVYGTRAMTESRTEIAQFIELVRRRTGAKQVDIVAHSQGVAQARMFLTDWDLPRLGDARAERPAVRRVIGLGGSNHGTRHPLRRLPRLRRAVDWLIRRVAGQAALDQFVGSEALEHLNRQGDTVPGVSYVMISSSLDRVVVPWRT